MMTTFLPSSVAAATARLTATVVRPTPPLGLKTATIEAGLAGLAGIRRPVGRGPVAAATGGDRHPALLVALAGADLPDRGGQLVAAERLDQELARAGEHRAAEVVGLALDGHHHDRRAGHDWTTSCSVAAMPSMSGMLMSISTTSGLESGGHLQGLATGRGGADHVDVALEAEQLRQVIAGLGDVVDDEDTDLVGHLALVGPCCWRCDGWCWVRPRWAPDRSVQSADRPVRWLPAESGREVVAIEGR